MKEKQQIMSILLKLVIKYIHQLSLSSFFTSHHLQSLSRSYSHSQTTVLKNSIVICRSRKNFIYKLPSGYKFFLLFFLEGGRGGLNRSTSIGGARRGQENSQRPFVEKWPLFSAFTRAQFVYNAYFFRAFLYTTTGHRNFAPRFSTSITIRAR